eukprot:TRINITY_DN1779_c0_g1_i1.p1 TRINITY_DN1779_c0_g1~~TRINITY_DN1779_c0_g1_i1.p1  ORF type:complete len:195 (-),score=34.09 TRINITY_DN1779_c0_g1_i1:45-554(-)
MSQPVDHCAAAIGLVGAVVSVGLTAIGSAYATSKKSQHFSSVATAQLPNDDAIPLMEKQQYDSPSVKQNTPHLSHFCGIIISGMIAIYGLIISVIILANLTGPVPYTMTKGICSLAAGLTVGICGLASGYALGQIKPNSNKYIYTVIIDIFAEAIGLYGLIVGLIMLSH